MKSLSGTALLTLTLIAACVPETAVREVPAEHLVLVNDDSLSCVILAGDILTTRVLTASGDTLELDNSAIDRIIALRSGRDITDRYIDRKAIKLELAKRAAFEKRSRQKTEAGVRDAKRTAGRNEPFAILAAELATGNGEPPQLELTVLNLGAKTIESFRLKVHCFDRNGQPVTGAGGRDNVFQATSRIPIDPDEDFTTTLHLRSHPRTRKAKVEIYLVDFVDKTRWIGIVSAAAE